MPQEEDPTPLDCIRVVSEDRDAPTSPARQPSGALSPLPHDDLPAIVEAFKRHGVVVVRDVLTKEEVKACRDGLHADLEAAFGVQYHRLAETAEGLRDKQSHFSGGLPLHYSPWRLHHCALNERFLRVTQAL